MDNIQNAFVGIFLHDVEDIIDDITIAAGPACQCIGAGAAVEYVITIQPVQCVNISRAD